MNRSSARDGKNYIPAPRAPGHAWPRTCDESRITRRIVPGGRQVVTVAADPKAMQKLDSGEKGLAPAAQPQPGERVPLCDVTQLQDMLLARVRDRGKDETGDWFVPRTHERVERLPPDPPTPEKLMVYLEALEGCGTHHRACAFARLTYEPVRRLRKAIPELEALVQDALERYREKLEHAAYSRGVEGWLEPILGGLNRDQVVTHVRKYDSRLLECMLKRHIPEYREKFEGEIRVTGGVLVVPAPALSAGDWAAQHGGEKLPPRADLGDQGKLPPAREIVADSPAA